MTTALFQQQRDNIKRLLADGIGCSPEDFEREALTVVDRPESTPWYIALAGTFGIGTVVSVESRFRGFIEAHAPKPHHRALHPVLLQRLVDECSSETEHFEYLIPGLCWALAEAPARDEAPAGFAFRALDAEWMNTRMPAGGWENGLGTTAQAREFRNQFGIGLFDGAGEPVAIAGAFLSYGMHEIGVDVARDHRGKGFGTLVVQALTREILDRGETPLYGCAADNIRSQRTALASGFLPVYSDAAVGVSPG